MRHKLGKLVYNEEGITVMQDDEGLSNKFRVFMYMNTGNIKVNLTVYLT